MTETKRQRKERLARERLERKQARSFQRLVAKHVMASDAPSSVTADAFRSAVAK